MREIIYDQPDLFVTWAESQISGCRFRPDAKAIGLLRDGAPAAAAIYDTFSVRSCFMHIASDGSKTWASREFLIRMFAFPFIQCDFTRVSAVISSLNEPSIRIVQQFGAQQEGMLRRAGAYDEDVLLFGMLREECRFLPAGLGIPALD